MVDIIWIPPTEQLWIHSATNVTFSLRMTKIILSKSAKFECYLKPIKIVFSNGSHSHCYNMRSHINSNSYRLKPCSDCWVSLWVLLDFIFLPFVFSNLQSVKQISVVWLKIIAWQCSQRDAQLKNYLTS